MILLYCVLGEQKAGRCISGQDLVNQDQDQSHLVLQVGEVTVKINTNKPADLLPSLMITIIIIK